MNCETHTVRMGEIGNESKVLIGKDEGKRQFGRPRRRLKDNIKMNVKDRILRCGFIWIKTETNDKILWTQQWTFVFYKMWGITNWYGLQLIHELVFILNFIKVIRLVQNLLCEDQQVHRCYHTEILTCLAKQCKSNIWSALIPNASRRGLPGCDAVYCGGRIPTIPKMEAAWSCHNTTQRHSTEDFEWNFQSLENLKSHLMLIVSVHETLVSPLFWANKKWPWTSPSTANLEISSNWLAWRSLLRSVRNRNTRSCQTGKRYASIILTLWR